MSRRDDEARRADGAGGLADLVTPHRIVVVLLVVAFAVWCSANSDSVRVDFFVSDRELPLFVALLVAAGIGLVVGWIVGRRGRHD